MSTQNEPFVSVIIAFLNEERFLEEAIKSVLEQEYTHWELLLVDDGSTDKSTDIAREYALKSAGKIIYCEHAGHINKGLSASRNAGIKKSTGVLIAFLDADDFWLPLKLANQVSIFEKNTDIGMIAEASNYWYRWEDATVENYIINIGAAQDVVYNPPQLLFELYPLSNGSAPCPSALILKREAIENAGYFEESFIKEFGMYEDQAFLTKIYLREKIYVSSTCNNLYRQRSESIVKTVRAEGKYDQVRMYFLEWFESYLNKKQIKNDHLHRLLTKALMPYRKPARYFLQHTLPARGLSLVKKLLPETLKKFVIKKSHP